VEFCSLRYVLPIRARVPWWEVEVVVELHNRKSSTRHVAGVEGSPRVRPRLRRLLAPWVEELEQVAREAHSLLTFPSLRSGFITFSP
jgi:hypothetical protein